MIHTNTIKGTYCFIANALLLVNLLLIFYSDLNSTLLSIHLGVRQGRVLGVGFSLKSKLICNFENINNITKCIVPKGYYSYLQQI